MTEWKILTGSWVICQNPVYHWLDPLGGMVLTGIYTQHLRE